IYVADTLDELLAGGRVIMDPNRLSADGTTAVNGYTVSPQGKIIAFAIAEGGSDWLTYLLRDLDTGEDVAADVRQAKFSVPGWRAAEAAPGRHAAGRGPADPGVPGQRPADVLGGHLARRPLRDHAPGAGDGEPEPALGLPDHRQRRGERARRAGPADRPARGDGRVRPRRRRPDQIG